MTHLFGVARCGLTEGLGRTPGLQPSSIFRFIFSIKSSAIHSVYPNNITITNNNNSTMQEELLQMKALLETMRIEMARILTKIDELDIFLHRLEPRFEHVGSYAEKRAKALSYNKTQYELLNGKSTDTFPSSEDFDEID